MVKMDDACRKLSIILPMYNVEHYIEKCIRSLEDQDIDRNLYEILVIDDGSPDNSSKIVERLQKEFSNITMYHKENGGLSSARNYGIERAEGEYCWFVDSDDYIEKNVLGELLFQLEENDLDYLGFIIYDVRGESRINGFKDIERPVDIISGLEYVKRYHIAQSACVHILRTEICRKYNLRFIEGIIHEDYEFVLRMYKFCNRMKFIDLPVYNYVIKESGSITSTRSYAQNKCSIDSWYIIINSLQKYFNNFTGNYSYYAHYWINNYKYIALTNLLVKPLPYKDKRKIYEQYKSVGIFNIGSNRLSLKRKIRTLFYRIPFIYLGFMYLLNRKLGENDRK